MDDKAIKRSIHIKLKDMKQKTKYMIYNDYTLFIKEFESLDDCKHWAINHLDQSHETIIRTVKGLVRNDKNKFIKSYFK